VRRPRYVREQMWSELTAKGYKLQAQIDIEGLWDWRATGNGMSGPWRKSPTQAKRDAVKHAREKGRNHA
jgi:hypothetical protein